MPDRTVTPPVIPRPPAPTVYPDKEQALHAFWSGFEWVARDENTVPDNAMVLYSGHYITYSLVTAALDERVQLPANLWCKDTSWATITAKANEIAAAIGIGGKLIPYTGGYLWITRGNPFSQRLASDDDTIRRIYLNCTAEYLSAD